MSKTHGKPEEGILVYVPDDIDEETYCEYQTATSSTKIIK